MRVTDPFVLECTGLPPGARVIAFEGTEEISATYRYQVDLLVDPDTDLSDAVSAAATLTVHSSDAEHYSVHGIVSSASIIEHLDDTDVYRLVLVPRIRSILGLDRHSRVFVGDAVPAMVQTVLREAGCSHEDCEFRLSRTYEPIDFVCQYRESTLDFLMRWMERDGIYFYFAHDGARERLVILDDMGRHAAPQVIAPYLRSAGLLEASGLRWFRSERHTVPGRVHVDDYDYMRPALPVRGEALVEGGGGGELRVRGAKVTTPKEANRIASLRAEGLRAQQTIFHGEGTLNGLHAGEFFTLSGHPRASFDGDYLATKLHVRGHDVGAVGKPVQDLVGRGDEPDRALRVEIEAISAAVQFRPELKTPPPKVHSMESGVIEGDLDSDYAQLDEHGRYLVKFRFDEREGRGSRASARIRMMQPHAGSPEGMHLPLRKGTEVLIAFVGGDPDRPVIAGAVHNALNPNVVRSDNATKNVIQTGGGNRIVMEDAEGKQYIHIATPHKKTYLHLGSPFNPQYHKITATGGTSLSFTDDISTSVSQTDSQTIVGDSRITIIGRSQIAATDTQGTEIQALTAPGFIVPGAGNATDTAINVILGTIKTHAKAVYAAGKPADGATAATADAGTTALAIAAATGQVATGAPTVSTTPGPTATSVTSAVAAALAAVDLASAAPSQTTTDGANAAIAKLQAAVTALIPAPGPSLGIDGMVTAVNNAVTGLTTLNADAQNLITTSSSSPPPIDFAPDVATLWGSQVTVALGVAANAPNPATGMLLAQSLSLQAQTDLKGSTFKTSLATIPPFDPTNPQNGISNVQSAIGVVKTAAADVTAAVNQILAAGSLAKIAVAAAPPPPTSTPPPLPNPNAPAIYNNLPHVDTSSPALLQTIPDFTDPVSGNPMAIDVGTNLPPNTAQNTTGVTPAGPDSTGLEPGDVAPYPLNAGSDIKIVGGDNVTIVAKDSRSQTAGHVHTLVGTKGTPGGTTSWVHGNVESTIDGDQHTKVGDWGSLKEVTSEIHGLQSSALYGEQNTLVVGSRTTEIAGLNTTVILGGEIKLVIGPILSGRVTPVGGIDWHAGAASLKLHTMAFKQEDSLATTISTQVAPMITSALAPVIATETTDIVDTLMLMHTIVMKLEDAETAIHTNTASIWSLAIAMFLEGG